jgi:hypothetical protein
MSCVKNKKKEENRKENFKDDLLFFSQHYYILGSLKSQLNEKITKQR